MKKLAALLALVALALPAAAWADGKTVNVFIWSEYMDPDVIEDFEKETGLKARLDYYESNEEMVAKLQGGGASQYDVIVPSTYFVASLKKLGLLRPLDKSLLPNLKNVGPAFAAAVEDDPQGEFVVPYLWGTSGIIARADKPVDSWGVFFDPAAEVGSFILFDTARDALGSALRYQGRSLNSADLKEVGEAAKLLVETKKRPAFFGFDGGVAGMNKVLGGLAAAAQVYSGEALKAVAENPGVQYVIPKEGCEVWMDLLAVPKDAPNPAGAHAFINYLLEPAVGARLAAYTNYATTNAAAMEFIPQEQRDNPLMYPPQEVLDGLETIRDLGRDNRLYDEAWTMVKTK